MKNNFKFIKTEDNRFRWESDFMVLEYSEPSIQAFQEYLPVKDFKDIMYYYYTVKIFKKIDNSKEILVSERYVYDFPCIDELKWIIEHQLNNNPTIDGQKIEYKSGDIRYRETFETEGFACEDFYSISKSTDENNKNERYSIYIGTTYDANGDLTSNGIRTPYINKHDLKELLKCVDGFIQYSIDKNNNSLKELEDCFKIKGNKLYEYDYENNLESIYVIGDFIKDITSIDNNKQCEEHDLIISDIRDDKVFFKGGICLFTKDIIYMCTNVQDNKLTYNEQQCAEDFISILNTDEKHEFISNDVNELLLKYKNAIVNRTNMCIDDKRNYMTKYEKNMGIEGITPVVETVINNIKYILSKGEM